MFFFFATSLADLVPEIAATTAADASALDVLGSGLGSSAAADIAAGEAGQLAAGAGLDAATTTAGSGILGADAASTGAATVADALPAAGSNVSQGITSVAPQAAQADQAINFNPASAYTAPNPNLVNNPSQFADFNMTGKTASEYSPLTGSQAASGATLPTTVSDNGILSQYLPDPIAKGFNDAYDLTKKIGTGMKDNPLLTAMGLQVAKNIAGTPEVAPHKNPPNPHPLSANYLPSRVYSDQSVYHPVYGAQGGIMNAYAGGGIAALAQGGIDSPGISPLGMGGNQAYPGGRLDTTQFATPSQMPTSSAVINSDYEMKTNPYTGEPGMAAGGILAFSSGSKTTAPDSNIHYLTAESPWNTNQDSDANTALLNAQDAAAYRQKKLENLVGYANRSKLNPSMALGQMNHVPAALQAQMAAQQAQGAAQPQTAPEDIQSMAGGGIMGHSTLGSYATGGNPRLLKGPGDGMSDNIPAVIANKQPARLADGEFVVPADVVSHLGNGSTDAGAKHLHAMMDNVRKARTGSKKQGKQIDPNKFLPA